MKKHNEGYVLAYVMVVIAVMMLVASSVMGVALKNLQRQRAEVETMQAKYTAEGAIERAVAELKLINSKTMIQDTTTENVIFDILEDTVSGNTCNVVITSKSGSVIVTCELKLENNDEITGSPLDGVPTYVLYGLTDLQYISYSVSTTEGGGDA